VQATLDSTLAWWIAGATLGPVIVSSLALANKCFGALGGVKLRPALARAADPSEGTSRVADPVQPRS
jgi:hypothetical protein